MKRRVLFCLVFPVCTVIALATIPAATFSSTATVGRIIDGDTFDLASPFLSTNRVRLIGVDTPEMRPRECYGPEARQRLAELVPVGSQVMLETDKTPYDRYRRLLAYVYTTDGQFVNLELVAGGYATSAAYRPNTTHRLEFEQAQDGAQEALMGLWGACPVEEG